MPKSPSVDSIIARNNTGVVIVLNGQKVGRVQSIREDISNNVQVLSELGRAYAVELKKGITTYTFSIASFYCRSDVMDKLKLGEIFSLVIRDEKTVGSDGTGSPENLEYFERCAFQSVSRDYTVGQASVGQNAQVVVVGKGLTAPALVA